MTPDVRRSLLRSAASTVEVVADALDAIFYLANGLSQAVRHRSYMLSSKADLLDQQIVAEVTGQDDG